MVALLLHTYIAPTYRRRGLARRALKSILQAVWASGASRTLAVVAVDNAAALGLLFDGGFHETEKILIGAEAHTRLELLAPPTS